MIPTPSCRGASPLEALDPKPRRLSPSMIAQGAGGDARDLRAPREAVAFEAARAFGHVKRLGYPRRVATPQERRAARYILRTFAALGLGRRRETFPVPLLAREVGTRVVFAVCAIAVLLGAWVVTARPLVAAACWVAAGILVNAPWRLAHALGSGWPTRATSQNLVATLPNPDAAEDVVPARVVFMAHYDTKSQALPTGIRVGLVIVATAACGLLAAGGLGASVGISSPWEGIVPALPAAVVAILAALSANVTGNLSPGALDNATGLGTLLELARTWRPRPGEPVEALWVATGAEEVGLDGARDFLRRHEGWWREKPTLLINLDSVGAGDRLYLAGEPRARQLAQETADGLGLPRARLCILGAGMDHEPFAARGLAAVSLLGDVVSRSLDLHTRRDTPELVDPSALDRAGRLAAHLAWSWAERHRPATREVSRAPSRQGKSRLAV